MSHKIGRDKRAREKRTAMQLERLAYGAMNSNPPTMPPIYRAAEYHERKRLESFITRVTKLSWIVNTWSAPRYVQSTGGATDCNSIMYDADELGIVNAVATCEKVADEIDAGIKRAMPCDCRAQGCRVRCGDCGQK